MMPAARTACTSRAATAAPISLREADVAMQHRCAAGSHVVFIGTSGLASMVMRGQLMHDVLNQTFSAHGATSSYIVVTAPTNTTKASNMLEAHFDSVGGPTACIVIKYSIAWVGAACRRRVYSRQQRVGADEGQQLGGVEAGDST